MSCIYNLKAAAFLESFGGTSNIAAGALTSLYTGSFQPLIVGSVISVVATSVGLVATALFKLCYPDALREDLAQLTLGTTIYILTNIVLHITAITTGFIPGGLVGCAMVVASLAINLLLIAVFEYPMYNCLQIEIN